MGTSLVPVSSLQPLLPIFRFLQYSTRPSRYCPHLYLPRTRKSSQSQDSVIVHSLNSFIPLLLFKVHATAFRPLTGWFVVEEQRCTGRATTHPPAGASKRGSTPSTQPCMVYRYPAWWIDISLSAHVLLVLGPSTTPQPSFRDPTALSIPKSSTAPSCACC